MSNIYYLKSSKEQILILGTVAMNKQPYVQIQEQPAEFIRFRYESEKKCINSILGINSTPKRKTFPSIQVSYNYVQQLFVGLSVYLYFFF